MGVVFTGPNGPEALIPAPLVTLERQSIKFANGQYSHTEYVFTLTGKIVNVETTKDSPAAQDYAGMEGILAEQKRIRNLFSQDGGRLEITSPGGGGPNSIDAYCSVDSIRFGEGVWVQLCDYTIILRARGIGEEDDPDAGLEGFSENWAITENEDGTFGISHTLQATGALVYNVDGQNDPLQAAKDWVVARTYSNNNAGAFLSGDGDVAFSLAELITPLGSTTQDYWDKSIVESVDPQTYSHNLTENFVYNPSGNTREQWSANLTYDNNDLRKVTITINGEVFGYADKLSNLDTRNSRAKAKFEADIEPNLYSRLISYVPVGFTLNPVPNNRQIGYERTGGVLRYTYGFTALKGNLIAGSVEENINVSVTAPSDIFAQIQAPGRTNGPIVQNMKTKTLPEKTVTINLLMTPDGNVLSLASLATLYAAKPNTNAIINALRPSAGYYYTRQNSEDWNPLRGQYSRVISWVMQPEGLTLSEVPASISNQPA